MLGFAFGVWASNTIPCAHAQQSEANADERRDSARHHFEQGERAYEAHDYVLAAKAFDQAYRIVPHHASLWNCARSWERAREYARAANAYAKYLRDAPADAPDRDAATTALATLAEMLGRIDVHAAEMEIIRVDDELLEGTSVYVNPGTHIIEGQTGESKTRRTEVIERGTVRSVALIIEKKKDVVEVPLVVPIVKASSNALPVQSAPFSTLGPNRTTNYYGPASIVAGGMTVVSASLLLWSGLDTLAARNDFDAAPTADKLAAGKDKQLRTNLFVGSTVTLGITTGVLFSLWKWKGSKSNSALIMLPPVWGLPAQLVATGSF